MSLKCAQTSRPGQAKLNEVQSDGSCSVVEVQEKAMDLGVIHDPEAPQEASEGRREEPGSHRPPSLPPVGAKQCRAAEGGTNSQVDPSSSTCLSLSRTNSILACTVNELNEARPSIELNKVPTSIKPNKVRSKSGQQEPSIEHNEVRANIKPSQARVIYMLTKAQIEFAQQELSRGSDSSDWDPGGDL